MAKGKYRSKKNPAQERKATSSSDWFNTTKIWEQFLLDRSQFNYSSPSRQNRPVTIKDIEHFSRDILVQRAIDIIATSVSGMQFVIKPPEGQSLDEPLVKETIRRLNESFESPNFEKKSNTYLGLVSAIVTDLLVFGESLLEKGDALPDDDSRFFWLWPIKYDYLEWNRAWQSHLAGVDPVAWFTKGKSSRNADWESLYHNEVVIFDNDNTSFRDIPDSPLKRLYEFIEWWKGITRYQNRVVNKANRSIINIEDATSNEQLEEARNNLKSVEGEGKMSFLGGKLKVIHLANRANEELYPQYAEFLIILISIGFNLSRRDMNLAEHDNRATAGVAASLTFQYAVLPIVKLIRDVFNQLVKAYAPGYSFNIVDLEPRNQEMEANTATQLFTNKLITLNEAREDVGKKPVFGGDVFFDGTKSDEEFLPEKKSNDEQNKSLNLPSN